MQREMTQRAGLSQVRIHHQSNAPHRLHTRSIAPTLIGEIWDDAISTWPTEHPLGDVLKALNGFHTPTGKISNASDIASASHYNVRKTILESTLADGPITLPEAPKPLTPPEQIRSKAPFFEHTDKCLTSETWSNYSKACLEGYNFCCATLRA